MCVWLALCVCVFARVHSVLVHPDLEGCGLRRTHCECHMNEYACQICKQERNVLYGVNDATSKWDIDGHRFLRLCRSNESTAWQWVQLERAKNKSERDYITMTMTTMNRCQNKHDLGYTIIAFISKYIKLRIYR